MTKVVFYHNKNDGLIGFKMDGHAQYKQKGEDIVCSAISMISQSTVLGLHDVAGIKITYSQRDGYLSCRLPEQLNEKERCMALAILGTMKVGLMNIRKKYGRYLDIDEEEV